MTPREFCVNWIEERSGITILTNQDIFLSTSLDSLDYAELLADLSVFVQQEYSTENIVDWNALRTIDGLVQGLFNVQ